MLLDISNRDKNGIFEIHRPGQGLGFSAIAFGHTSRNYPMYAPIPLVIVGRSLASLALAGAFGFCATAPAPPRFERAPSPLLSLPVSQCGYSGVSLSGSKEK